MVSKASASLILLIAKPTWIKTQSPGLGQSSCNRPKSTFRRTPSTSTTARFGSSSTDSTIFPGMARHIFLFLFPGDDIKSKLQLILELQRPAGYAHRVDAVGALQESKLAGGPERVAAESHLRG